jgi:hypothetical protein
VFNSVTDRLIPLFAVGAFLAFTLSQSEWSRIGGRARSAERALVVVNGLGAVATAITVVIVVVVKLMTGASMVVLLVPSLVVLMLAVGRHYRRIGARNCVARQSVARESARTYRDRADHSVEVDRENRVAARDDVVTRGRSPAYRK